MVCYKYKLSDIIHGQGNFDTVMSDVAFSSDDGSEGNRGSGGDEQAMMRMRISDILKIQVMKCITSVMLNDVTRLIHSVFPPGKKDSELSW